MCSVCQKTFLKILLRQVWRIISINDWLLLVLVNCQPLVLDQGIIPIKSNFNILGYFVFLKMEGLPLSIQLLHFDQAMIPMYRRAVTWWVTT